MASTAIARARRKRQVTVVRVDLFDKSDATLGKAESHRSRGFAWERDPWMPVGEFPHNPGLVIVFLIVIGQRRDDHDYEQEQEHEDEAGSGESLRAAQSGSVGAQRDDRIDP